MLSWVAPIRATRRDNVRPAPTTTGRSLALPYCQLVRIISLKDKLVQFVGETVSLLDWIVRCQLYIKGFGKELI